MHAISRHLELEPSLAKRHSGDYIVYRARDFSTYISFISPFAKLILAMPFAPASAERSSTAGRSARHG
eukprot:674239-Prymnesium_polylepis.1